MRARREVYISISVQSNVTNMFNLTAPEYYIKEELTEMLQNARMSRKSEKGSALKGNGKPRQKTSELEESSSGSNNSDSSSTSSEEEESEYDAAP